VRLTGLQSDSELSTTNRVTCYHVKLGTCVTKGVRVNGKEPPELENAGTPPPILSGEGVTEYMQTNPIPI